MTTYALNKQMEAAKVLREQLAALAVDDPEFVRDTIEGETSLLEMIAIEVSAVAEDETLAKAIAERKSELDARQKRIEKRADLRRALIASAMEIGEVRKLETADGTVSLRPVPPKVVVSEEADIPAEFWKTGDPKLDRKALTEALKARAATLSDAQRIDDADERAAAIAQAVAAHPEILGASLSNGSITISIRSK